MQQTRRALIGALAIALLTMAGAAPSPAAADDLKEVRIGFQRAGIFPATKQRHTVEDAFKSRGIDVKWVEFAFGPPLLEALNTGNIDYGYTGDAPPVFAQAARANLLYVAALPSAGKNEAIVVPENSPIKTVADLKGKRVGFAKASSSHNTTVAALEKAGLSYSDITPVYLAPADAAVAFAGGNLDAWTIWDPYLALVEKGKVRVIVSAKDVHEANAFFLANRDFTAKHPDVVAKLNQIFADESVWATSHHAEIVKALHESTGLETEALTRAVDRTQFLVTPVTDKVTATQQTVADRFHKLGLVPKPVDVKEIVWTWTPGS
ncbi:aliphatic sulfonate ABC transporter substrate-binding protein [Rhodopseudomonas rhenobacensis]|uniref:aliphatic sulfonate ABC transporter substrate-binding protein n=1 Tax=Rhodopseudomonas rhenobacensis TaxID=87461 RepID=UPI0016101677|nr:aliphatic sulfonate ABC transporter substrate-binding protein [Rhodopseudomonas rhenobacensis]